MGDTGRTSGLADSGRWIITCKDLASFKGRRHDLVLEWRRRDGIWDRECIAETPTLVSSLHEFRIAPGQAADTWQAQGAIDPDPWTLVGGPVKLEITLPWQDTGEGRYAGTFGDERIEGDVVARYEPEWPAALGVSTQRPAILEEFERTGSAGRLYDFSHAGRGTVDPCPSLPVLDAREFGVRPDSGEEATPGLQAALDAAGERGGAIVQLPPGVLDFNVERKWPTLRIRHDGVVLRGAGSGTGGTLIVNHRYSDSPEPDKPWLAGMFPWLIIAPETMEDPTPLTAVTAGRRGDLELTVADASGVRVGQAYLVRQLETDGSLARDLVQGMVEVERNWQGEGQELVSQLVTVRDVQGGRITLDAPLHRSIGPWPAELCEVAMLDGAGICSLRIRGLWDGFFVHHKSPEHDNGWDHVKFRRVRGGWASDIVHENTTSAIGLNDCLGCVVSDCRILGNPGHNGFGINGRSTGNLMVRCHAGRSMHGFNMQGTMSGNAVVDCSADEPSAIDLHGGIGCDNLFDALTGGINKGGGSLTAVPPRHGPGLVLWNWCCGQYDPYKPWKRFRRQAECDTMPGFIAVGVHGMYGQRIAYKGPGGLFHEAVDEPWGLVELPGQRVEPRSLHSWQCERARGQ